MVSERRILFISAPIGAGHQKAAQAVGAAMRRLEPGILTPVYANVFDFFPAAAGQLILGGYLRLLGICPKAYALAYAWGNESRMALGGRELISRYLASRMADYITRLQPAAVVCTHATPAGLAAVLLQQKRLSVPVFAVVSDFVVHRLWVYPELNGYFVADNELADYLGGKGVDRSKCFVTGIPVHEDFSMPLQRETILSAMNFSPKLPTILLMGGGAGVLPMEEIVRTCEKLGRKLQLIAVCGHNQGVAANLAHLAGKLRNVTLHTYGFVNNVHELMSAADLLISKPGGMSTSEALAKGLPLIMYRPIPGQEEANALYLLKHDAALLVRTPQDLERTLARLVDNLDELAALRLRAGELGKPFAAASVARGILEIIR